MHLTESAKHREILDQKQCGVVKCRGREKDGEKLEQEKGICLFKSYYISFITEVEGRSSRHEK